MKEEQHLFINLSLLNKMSLILQHKSPIHETKFIVSLVVAFFDRLWTGIKHLAPKIPGIAKSVLGHFKDENPIANSAHNVLSALGYGKRGGNSHKINDHLL